MRVYRTDLDGTVIFYCDGYDMPVSTIPWEMGVRSSAAGHVETGYIGNINSKVFHRSTCGTLPAPQNQTPFQSRAEALEAGYRPCKKCNP